MNNWIRIFSPSGQKCSRSCWLQEGHNLLRVKKFWQSPWREDELRSRKQKIAWVAEESAQKRPSEVGFLLLQQKEEQSRIYFFNWQGVGLHRHGNCEGWPSHLEGKCWSIHHQTGAQKGDMGEKGRMQNVFSLSKLKQVTFLPFPPWSTRVDGEHEWSSENWDYSFPFWCV